MFVCMCVWKQKGLFERRMEGIEGRVMGMNKAQLYVWKYNETIISYNN